MSALKKLGVGAVAAATLGLGMLGAAPQPAQAASDCTLSRVWQGWKGGCRWGVTQLKVQCVDGPKVYYAYSNKSESRDHVARCSIFYRPNQVWIMHF